jgi:ABC-type multidrug transport system ATPase subunit
VPEVLGLADRVLVMREGRLIREAPATDLDESTVLDLVMAGSLLEGPDALEALNVVGHAPTALDDDITGVAEKTGGAA